MGTTCPTGNQWTQSMGALNITQHKRQLPPPGKNVKTTHATKSKSLVRNPMLGLLPLQGIVGTLPGGICFGDTGGIPPYKEANLCTCIHWFYRKGYVH